MLKINTTSSSLLLAATIAGFVSLVATDPLQITQDDYEQLHAHDLSDEEIFEIVATADLFSSINAYTDGARVEIDQLG